MAAHVEFESDLLVAPRSVPETVHRAIAQSSAATALPWRRFWLLVAAPVLIVAMMIARFGVDTPHYDQWIGESFLFEKMAAGTLGPGDFFVQHNEHRLPVPKLAMLAAGLLTGWNTKVEMFLTLLLLTAVAASYWRTLRATGWTDSAQTGGAFLAVALLAFSLVQYENFLWGFQLHFVSSILFFTACAWVATELRASWAFIGTMLLATAATFSIASGFLCWLLATPVLLLPRGELRWRGFGKWWAGYGIAFAANLALYFAHYEKPAKHPGLQTILQRPLGGLQYLATYLGSPFGRGTAFAAPEASMWIGASLLVLLAGAVFGIWRARRDAAVLGRALPWLMISLFGLANGTITAIGRLGFGPAQAMESRYCTYALLVPIGLIPLAIVLAERSRRGRENAGTLALPAITAVASVFLTLSVLSSAKAFGEWAIYQRAFRLEKALVQTVDWANEPGLLRTNVTPNASALAATVHALDRLGYLRPSIWKSGAISEAGNPADPGSRECGQVEGKVRANGEIFLCGWAVLPDRGRVADAVLLTCDDASGMPVLVGLAPVAVERPDVAKATGNSEYFGSGWAVQWAREKIPAGRSAIKAWAYDSEERRALRLEGLVTLPR